MSKFKAGDIVRTTDYSYAMRLHANGRLNTSVTSGGQLAESLEIIATGPLCLPGLDSLGCYEKNDTIVRRKTDGAILFIKERFLRPFPPLKKKVKVEVRPYGISNSKNTFGLLVDTSNITAVRWCGPIQTVEIEVDDD